MARETRIRCNLCGKPFDDADTYQGFCITRKIGYGSRYDGCGITLDICCRCMDTLIDQCALPPLEGEEEALPESSREGGN